jgi:GNAT superfamily N-acetyltransferase
LETKRLVPIQIIQLSPQEWQRYREIRLEALRAEPQAFGSTYADSEQRPAAYWQERLADAQRGVDSWLLFAQEGEHLVGMIGAFYDERREAAIIVSVYVSQAARGKGVGKALMEAILAEVGKRKDIRKAALGVVREQAAAVALYRRFGFEVTEEHEEAQGDGKMHRGYWMEKRMM